MSPQLEAVLFVFSLIALGYLAGLTGYLKAEVGDALSEFAVSVAVPLLLIRTMQSADFHGAAPWLLWTAYYLSAAVSWIAGHFITTRLFGRDARTGVIGGVSAAFSNTVLLGIPMVLGLYGQEGFELLTLIIAIHLPILLAAAILMSALFDHDGSSDLRPGPMLASLAGKLVRNPLMIGIFAGLAFRITGAGFPPLAGRIIDALANIAGPLALFAIGLGLRRYGIMRNATTGMALAAVKLLLMPATALALSILLGLPPLAAQVVVVTAAMPTGVNAYLMAVQFGTGHAISTNAMTLSVAFGVVTTTIWIALLHVIYG